MTNLTKYARIFFLLLITGCTTNQGPAPVQDGDPVKSRQVTPERFEINRSETSAITPVITIDPEDYYDPEYRSRVVVMSEPAERISSDGLKHDSRVAGAHLISAREDMPDTPGQYFNAGDTRLFVINFDNDIFDNTDYYYTNGIAFEFTHPGLAFLPTSRVLIPGGKNAVNHYSISLVQNMYTPVDPDKNDIQLGDRPFSAYLYAGFGLISNNPVNLQRVTSELYLGIMGPGAFGGFVQATIHDIEPVGWTNQIQNSIIVNYNAEYEKGLVSTGFIELNVDGGFQAGTLYDNLYAGMRLRIGKISPYFSTITQTTLNTSGDRLRYFFLVDIQNKLVAYDATLQGSLFSSQDSYVILPSGINRYVLNASAGIGAAYGRFSLVLQQHYLTPEFKGGKHFLYGRIKAGVRL